MDFFLKDDDEGGFLCENCGSPDSYEDGTGKVICSNCFTQSQGVVCTQETDFEDIAKMGNMKGGNMVKQKSQLAGGPSKKRGRQPLEELDSSKPLPDLAVCVKGFQTVLGGGVRCVGTILKLNAEELQAVYDSVGTIWSGYVIAWRDAAEEYGASYPDFRLSMRDLFLNKTYLASISRVISYKVAERVRSECNHPIQKVELQESAESDSSGSDSDDSIISVKDKQANVEAHAIRWSRGKVSKRRKCPRNVHQLMDQLQTNNKGRAEAALALRPSMNMAAAIIWLAISRVGVTTGQIVDWIANGCLPLLNAFDMLLPMQEQNNLQYLKSFFCMPAPPTVDYIESLAAKLAITCGTQSTPGLPQYSSDSDEDGRPKVVKRLRFAAVDCIPSMVGQLVANLGLGQGVLDIAMALIGQPHPTNGESKLPTKFESVDRWLPPPLQRAHPRRICSPEYALAVIVVACKMCAGWDNWAYSRAGRVHHKANAHQKRDNSRDSCCHRFIPWNEEQFNLLKEDEQIPDYLDFFEETMASKQTTNAKLAGLPFPALASLFEKACKRGRNGSDEKKTMRSGVKATTRSSEMATTEYSPYISYPNMSSHKMNAHKGHIPYQEKTKLTGEPFHSCYLGLVEYISFKSRVAAHKIHTIVAELDEEVVALCGRKKKFKEKSRKRKRRKKEKSSLMPSLEQSLSMPSATMATFAEI